jgi:hypothetical protein
MSRVQIVTATETPIHPAPRGRAVLLVVAAASLSVSLFLSDGMYGAGRTDIAMLAAALALLLAAALLPDSDLRWLCPPTVLVTAIVLCLGAYFALVLVWPPADYPRFVLILTAGADKYLALYGLNFYWSLMAFAALVAGTLAAKNAALASFTFPALVLIQAILSVWMIRCDPIPFVDVWTFEQTGMHALLSGHDPYATPMPNISAHLPNHSVVYGPGVENGDLLNYGYPYMPLSLMVTLIGAIPGDVRYAMAASLAGAALLIGYSRPGNLPKLAAVALLFMPRTLFVIDWAWTDPIIVLFLALTVFCARRLPRLMPYALGLLMASKQYMAAAILLLPLLVGWDNRRLLAAAIRACATAAAVTLPGVLMHPRAFIASVIMWQIHQPFRPDALSFLAAASNRLGPHWQLPAWIGFAVLIAVAALALSRVRPSPAGFAMALALIYFAFFAFSKQAFMNYYFLVIGAIWCAVAATDVSEPDNPSLASFTAVPQ